MIEFVGRSYKSPLWLASGTFGWGIEAWDGGYFPRAGAGALVTKGVSPEEMRGAPQSRIAEVGHGVALLNAIGLQNPGVTGFLDKYARRYAKGEPACPVWVNVFAGNELGYVRVIEAIEDFAALHKGDWLAGYELNVSCPNVDKGGAEFGADPRVLEQLTKRCVQAARARPVMVKLSPMASQPVEMAKAAAAGGARALAVSNTFLAGFPEPEKRGADGKVAWALGRRYGGMSGPALKPMALRILDQVSRAVPLPLCGIGGIQCAHDVEEFLSAGATVVQVGTANFANPWLCDEIAAKLKSNS